MAPPLPFTQEQMAVLSHRKASIAQTAGHFERKIVPIRTSHGTVANDGCIRANTTAEVLAAFKPAFDAEGTITADTLSMPS
jgi:acetyl-CoA acyltransferase